MQSEETGGILTNSYIRNPAEEWTKVHSSLLVRRNYSVSKREEYEQKTEELLEPIISELGFELVDVEYVKEGGTWYLRAYIDKPGGITVDDCEAVSRRFSDILDEKDYIEDSYVFEVSSPGLGRPLKKEKDFAGASARKSRSGHTGRSTGRKNLPGSSKVMTGIPLRSHMKMTQNRHLTGLISP